MELIRPIIRLIYFDREVRKYNNPVFSNLYGLIKSYITSFNPQTNIENPIPIEDVKMYTHITSPQVMGQSIDMGLINSFVDPRVCNEGRAFLKHWFTRDVFPFSKLVQLLSYSDYSIMSYWLSIVDENCRPIKELITLESLDRITTGVLINEPNMMAKLFLNELSRLTMYIRIRQYYFNENRPQRLLFESISLLSSSLNKVTIHRILHSLSNEDKNDLRYIIKDVKTYYHI